MLMKSNFLDQQVALEFWPVYKSRFILWIDLQGIRDQLIHEKMW